MTVPRHAGQLPVYYNMKKSKRYWQQFGWGHAYVDMEPTPLYSFGHGLSYTRFEYSGLQFSAKEIGPADSVDVRFQVKNAGDRAGKETVQLYIEELVSSVSTPVKQLRGFAKLDLDAGRDQDLFVQAGTRRSGDLRPRYATRGRAGPLSRDGRFVLRRHPRKRRIPGYGQAQIMTSRQKQRLGLSCLLGFGGQVGQMPRKTRTATRPYVRTDFDHRRGKSAGQLAFHAVLG